MALYSAGQGGSAIAPHDAGGIIGGQWDAAIETFAGFVTHAYHFSDLYGTDKMQFAARSVGEVYNYPVIGKSQAQNLEDGALITSTALGDGSIANDITTEELVVDKPLKDYRMIPRDQIEVRPDLRIPENFGMMLGRSIAEAKHLRIHNFLANEADGASAGESNIVTHGFTSAPDWKKAFNDVSYQMDELGVPTEGRYCMLRSKYFYDLLAIEGMITKEWGGQANVQRPGPYIYYANLTIMNCNHAWGNYTTSAWNHLDTKYQRDNTKLGAVVWHKEAWVMRHWTEPSTQVDWSTMYDAYKAEARLTMGVAAIQRDGIWIIEDSDT